MELKTKRLIIDIIIVAIITSFVIFFTIKNSLIDIREDVEMQQSQIETAMQRRNDLIPILVATVKGYAAHENEVFTSIAEARTKLTESINSGNLSSINEANASLDSALGKLIAIAEDYPELKVSEQFIALQDELAGTENRIAVARQYYNEKVKTYNTAVQRFPKSIVANISGFYPMEYFEADEGAHEVPSVSFD